jgi:nucleoside-diphosphate-sugar epimerase
MTERIIILGGAGQLARAVAPAFKAAGWQVASLVRGRSAARAAAGTEIIEVDARRTPIPSLPPQRAPTSCSTPSMCRSRNGTASP